MLISQTIPLCGRERAEAQHPDWIKTNLGKKLVKKTGLQQNKDEDHGLQHIYIHTQQLTCHSASHPPPSEEEIGLIDIGAAGVGNTKKYLL